MEATTLSESKSLCRHLRQVQQRFTVWGMARPVGLFEQGRFLRSLPGASQGRGRCRVYVSGLGERAGGVNRRKLDFRELLHPAGCGLVRDFWDEYQGQYDDEEDFAYRIVEECYDLPEFAKSYFDYEKFARDLFMCDYWMDEGFVFRAA